MEPPKPNSMSSPPQSPPQKKQKTQINPNLMSSPPRKKKKTQITDIPMDFLFHEILTRLPAKHLARLKCVSPDWNSAISTTEFAAKHLLHSSSSRSVLTLDFKRSFEALDYGDYPENHEFSRFGKNFTNAFPFLIGSSNGLALLICSYGKYRTYHPKLEGPETVFSECLLYYDYHFVVHNPVLGNDSFIEIQQPVTFLEFAFKDSFKADNYSFGFGYVSSHDDYYIVALNFLRNPLWIVVYVYSLKTRKWVRFESSQMNQLRRHVITFQDHWYDHCGVLLKETLHWGITVTEGNHSQNYIVAFDLATQNNYIIMQLPYPKFGNSGGYIRFSLGCMDDCLCAWQWGIGSTIDENGHSLWMLKEYGLYTSWTPLYSFRSPICRDFFGYTKSRMVLVYFSFGGVLQIADFSPNRAVLSDLDFKRKRFAVNHVQSLVSPFSPNLKQRG